MATKKFRFLSIEAVGSMPVPRDLSPEEEAAIIAQARLEFDPEASEAECRELLRQREKGLLVSGEDVLKKLDELEAVDLKNQREPA